MAYDSTKPADDEYLSAFPAEMREQLRAIMEDALVNALKVRGYSPGNLTGNIPLNNGTLNTNLNADQLDGHDASYFSADGHVHAAATPSSNGFMANTDKAKLDGVATGAEVNQNAFSNVAVAGTTIQADNKTDTLTFEAGANIAITPDATNDKVNIAVTGTVNNSDMLDGKHASDFSPNNVVPSPFSVSGTTTGSSFPTGISYSPIYNNGFPVSYGNALTIKNQGMTQFAFEWSGSNATPGEIWFRNARDSSIDSWSGWRKILHSNGGAIAGNLVFDDSSENKLYGANHNCGLSMYGGGLALYDWANNRSVWNYTFADNIVRCDADAKFSHQVYTDGWFRTTGETGWYSEKYAGGWYMADTTWIRAYNNKSVYTQGVFQADGGFNGRLNGCAGSLARSGDNTIPMTFNWSGQNGQPPWLWGGSDGTNMYVYNPSNFSVNYANSAGSINGYSADSITRRVSGRNTPIITPLMVHDNWVTNTGAGMSGKTGGDIALSQDYRNFDKILVIGNDDNCNAPMTALWEKWELDFVFNNTWRFNIFKDYYLNWWVYSSVKLGTTVNSLSTPTLWYTQQQATVINEIYGINY